MNKSASISTLRRPLLPCLPGCDVVHPADRPQECHVSERVGIAQSVVSTATTTITAVGATETTDRFPSVLVTRTDLHVDRETELTPGQARELAVLLLAAADRAESLAGVAPLDAA